MSDYNIISYLMLNLSFPNGFIPLSISPINSIFQNEQIKANADSSWNAQHVFLHVYYLVILWVVALTVPYSKLAALRAEA